jgi:hypothetical protein
MLSIHSGWHRTCTTCGQQYDVPAMPLPACTRGRSTPPVIRNALSASRHRSPGQAEALRHTDFGVDPTTQAAAFERPAAEAGMQCRSLSSSRSALDV